MRDTFGARVIFPAPGDEQPDIVTLVGKKENVEKAKEHLIEQLKELVSGVGGGGGVGGERWGGVGGERWAEGVRGRSPLYDSRLASVAVSNIRALLESCFLSSNSTIYVKLLVLYCG